jgi:hypothetical protein
MNYAIYRLSANSNITCLNALLKLAFDYGVWGLIYISFLRIVHALYVTHSHECFYAYYFILINVIYDYLTWSQLLLTFIVQWKMFKNSIPSHACFD